MKIYLVYLFGAVTAKFCSMKNCVICKREQEMLKKCDGGANCVKDDKSDKSVIHSRSALSKLSSVCDEMLEQCCRLGPRLSPRTKALDFKMALVIGGSIVTWLVLRCIKISKDYKEPVFDPRTPQNPRIRRQMSHMSTCPLSAENRFSKMNPQIN